MRDGTHGMRALRGRKIRGRRGGRPLHRKQEVRGMEYTKTDYIRFIGELLAELPLDDVKMI